MTRIGPVVAPVGTVAVICVGEFTANPGADVWLNLTAVAPVKPVPVMTTDVPTVPLVGANELTVGHAVAATERSAFVSESPAGPRKPQRWPAPSL